MSSRLHDDTSNENNNRNMTLHFLSMPLLPTRNQTNKETNVRTKVEPVRSSNG